MAIEVKCSITNCGAGKVRKECVEGLKRVVALRKVEWARQVAALNLLPSCTMLTLLDKRFGGELTQQDVDVSVHWRRFLRPNRKYRLCILVCDGGWTKR